MKYTAQVTCGLSKGPCRHKETWRWSEEVADEVRKKSMEIRRKEIRQKHGRRTRTVNKMQIGLSPSQT